MMSVRFRSGPFTIPITGIARCASLSAARAAFTCATPPSTRMRSGRGQSFLKRRSSTSLRHAGSFAPSTVLMRNLRYWSNSLRSPVKTTIEPVAEVPEIFEMSYPSMRGARRGARPAATSAILSSVMSAVSRICSRAKICRRSVSAFSNSNARLAAFISFASCLATALFLPAKSRRTFRIVFRYSARGTVPMQVPGQRPTCASKHGRENAPISSGLWTLHGKMRRRMRTASFRLPASAKGPNRFPRFGSLPRTRSTRGNFSLAIST